MTATVYYADRDRRVKELSRARKPALAEICWAASGRVMPLTNLLAWRKDELVTAILGLEFPPIPGPGTPVTVRQDCTLPWLRGQAGVVVGRSSTGVKVLLANRGYEKKLPMFFVPFELEVSR